MDAIDSRYLRYLELDDPNLPAWIRACEEWADDFARVFASREWQEVTFLFTCVMNTLRLYCEVQLGAAGLRQQKTARHAPHAPNAPNVPDCGSASRSCQPDVTQATTTIGEAEAAAAAACSLRAPSSVESLTCGGSFDERFPWYQLPSGFASVHWDPSLRMPPNPTYPCTEGRPLQQPRFIALAIPEELLDPRAYYAERKQREEEDSKKRMAEAARKQQEVEEETKKRKADQIAEEEEAMRVQQLAAAAADEAESQLFRKRLVDVLLHAHLEAQREAAAEEAARARVAAAAAVAVAAAAAAAVAAERTAGDAAATRCEWRTFPLNEQYECSRLGAVRHVLSKGVLGGTVKGKYVYVKLGKQDVKRCNVVASCWSAKGQLLELGEGGAATKGGKKAVYRAFHCDGDALNDAASNLVVLNVNGPEVKRLKV